MGVVKHPNLLQLNFSGGGGQLEVQSNLQTNYHFLFYEHQCMCYLSTVVYCKHAATIWLLTLLRFEVDTKEKKVFE